MQSSLMNPSYLISYGTQMQHGFFLIDQLIISTSNFISCTSSDYQSTHASKLCGFFATLQAIDRICLITILSYDIILNLVSEFLSSL